MINIDGHVITPTIFPDKTSQVWKLSHEIVEWMTTADEVIVTWDFENEGELIQVCQLADLARSISHGMISLKCSYLPYGRQDKELSNTSTFALDTFCSIVSRFFDKLITFDCHNPKAGCLDVYEMSFVDLTPAKEIVDAILYSNADMICYPDGGAKDRYHKIMEKSNIPYCVLQKDRDQLTGDITGLSFDMSQGSLVLDASILIVDDIADGSRTFIEAAKLLRVNGARKVDLYVSHGLFTKGVDIVYESGISEIYTKNGILCV